MNSVHDLGGMHNMGRVAVEENEPVFHTDWERLTFAMLFGTMGNGLINLDEFRHGIERMNPVHYLASRYYEHWLYTMEKNLLEKGHISPQELEARTKQYLERPEAPLPKRQDPALTERMLLVIREGAPTRKPVEAGPRFKVGDRVVMRNVHPYGHTRLARYVRGKRGVIAHVYDSYILPDTNAHGLGENPQYVYSVRFEARELWGDSAEPNEVVYFDAWESYLEPAE